MPSIFEAKKQLKHFEKDPSMPHDVFVLMKKCVRYAKFHRLTGLFSLMNYSLISEEDVEQLRSRFNQILNDKAYASTIQNEVYLTDAVYLALLALAELKPLNQECCISLGKISANNKVFTSTGHQFDIEQLIKYHNSRVCKREFQEEDRNYKVLFNPNTNQRFSYRDSALILKIATQKGLAIQWQDDKKESGARARAENIIMFISALNNILAQQGCVDELADLIGDANIYCAKLIRLVAHLSILGLCFFDIIIMMTGVVLDRLIIDINTYVNPSSMENRVGLTELGVVVAGSSFILATGVGLFAYPKIKTYLSTANQLEPLRMEGNAGLTRYFS